MCAVLIGTQAFAQFSVTSPNSGDTLGKTNTIRFLIENITSQARVVATATNNAKPNIRISTEALLDPDADKRILGTLDLNFDETTESGTYTLQVQYLTQGVVRDTRTITNLTIDTKNPKFRNVTPRSGSFVSVLVPVRAEVEEPGLDRWRVRVNDRDIPNNSGSTTDIAVDWTTSNIENDGPASITIKVDDKARNSATKTINVTLDRVSPSSQVKSPAGVSYRPTSIIPVVIEIADQYEGSVIAGGVNASLYTMDGQYIGRVARRSATNSGATLRWVGRIKGTSRLPKQFKMVVTAIDRAGNRAVDQTVTVNISGR